MCHVIAFYLTLRTPSWRKHAGVLRQLDDRVDREKIKNFLLTKYAGGHCVKNARVEDVSYHIMDGTKCQFDADQPHFTTWLWVHNKYHHDSMPLMFPRKPDAVPLYYAALFGLGDLATHFLAEHPEYEDAQGGYEVTPLHAMRRMVIYEFPIFETVDLRTHYTE